MTRSVQVAFFTKRRVQVCVFCPLTGCVHVCYTEGTTETTARETTDETAAEFIDIIAKLVRLPGIIIELCGSWLWITGEYRKGKGEMSLDDIRIKYGSTQYTSRQPAQLAAVMA